MIRRDTRPCASCDADLIGHNVVVIRTVIFNGEPAHVSVCVPCDASLPISDLRWYPRKKED